MGCTPEDEEFYRKMKAAIDNIQRPFDDETPIIDRIDRLRERLKDRPVMIVCNVPHKSWYLAVTQMQRVYSDWPIFYTMDFADGESVTGEIKSQSPVQLLLERSELLKEPDFVTIGSKRVTEGMMHEIALIGKAFDKCETSVSSLKDLASTVCPAVITKIGPSTQPTSKRAKRFQHPDPDSRQARYSKSRKR